MSHAKEHMALKLIIWGIKMGRISKSPSNLLRPKGKKWEKIRVGVLCRDTMVFNKKN